MVVHNRNSQPTAVEGIAAQARSAGKWAFVAEVTGRIAQPLVLLALARILTPDDFGVVTAATILVSLVQLFWDAGLAKALVQREATPAETLQSATVVFWSNLGLALVLYALVFWGAVVIAAAFGDARIVALVRVQGLAIPLQAMSSVPLALFQRELRFRPIFLSRLGAAVAPAFVGLPLAFWGAGYWALVAGSLAAAVLQVGILFRLSDWRPDRSWSWRQVEKLARFGVWSSGEALLSWSILWLDAIVVGTHLSSYDLGIYRTGNMAVTLAFGLTVGAIMPVLFAAFSRLQSEQSALAGLFTKAVKGVALIAMLLTAIAVAAPYDLSEIVFGPQWHAMGRVVFYLAIMHGLSWLVAPNAELYRAMGRPDLNLKINAVCLLFYGPVFFWAAQHGIGCFLQARLFVAMIAFAIHVGVAWRVARFTPKCFVQSVGWFVAAGVGASSAGMLLHSWLDVPLFVRTGAVIACCVIVFGVFCVREWDFVFYLWKQTHQKGTRHVCVD